MIVSDMKVTTARGLIPGKCAMCAKPVFESISLLDDAYNVWMGRCPHCKALNYLAMTGLRGYSSGGMELVLPTDEEKAANDLPSDCPTSGPSGRPADAHGTIAGTIQHMIIAGEK